jgi:integrase
MAARGRYGDGSIRAKGSSYEIRWRDDLGQHSRSVPLELGEQGALAELRRLTAARDIGTPAVAGRRLTIATYLDTWLETREVRPGTLSVYENVVRLYLTPELGRLSLAELQIRDVSAAMVRLRKRPSQRGPGTLSRATVTQAHKLLSHALADAVAEGLIARNVAALADRPRASSDDDEPIVPPSEVELRRIIRATRDHPYRMAYALAVGTGMRQGEVLGLRWVDVDREAGILRVRGSLRQGTQHLGPTKTRAGRRDLPIPAVVAEALDAQGVRGTFVCSTRDGRAMNARNLLHHWKRLCEREGIRPPADSGYTSYRWHDLRHAYATVQLAHGRNASHLAYLMGHGSIHELARYGHPQPSVEAAATIDQVLAG